MHPTAAPHSSAATKSALRKTKPWTCNAGTVQVIGNATTSMIPTRVTTTHPGTL